MKAMQSAKVEIVSGDVPTPGLACSWCHSPEAAAPGGVGAWDRGQWRVAVEHGPWIRGLDAEGRTMYEGTLCVAHFAELADIERRALLAQSLIDAADEGGVIQAEKMVPLAPGRPELHTTTMLLQAAHSLGVTAEVNGLLG